jgi:hypothetical protein
MNDLPIFDPATWYWLADDSRVYAGPTQLQVTDTDPDYVAWIGAGRTPIAWPRDEAGNQTDEALQTALAPYGMFASLTYYAADARWRRQTGGIIVTGIQYRSDRISANERNRAYNYALADPSAIFQWKRPDGTFVSLDNAAMTKVALSESTFVQACFACEKTTVASIAGASITTHAQVDAAFAAVSNVFP